MMQFWQTSPPQAPGSWDFAGATSSNAWRAAATVSCFRSRGTYDAQIFTNDREKLGAALGHDVSHSSAHAPEMKPEQKHEQAVAPQLEIAPQQEQGEDIGLGL
jgi:hypothetical protein